MRQDSRPRVSLRPLRLSLATAGLLAFSLVVWLLTPAGPATAMAARLPASASCAQLAHVDPTATNGSAWGATLMPGFGASGGWFGVPICANSVNLVAPGGANVSCDRVPSNYASSGCAPGSVTEDGYGWSFQCVELVIRFTAWAFNAPTGDWHGDAQYLWLSDDHPGSFTPYFNGGATPPVPGDILVWGSLDSQGRIWPAGPSGGHVAVVASTGGGAISFVEENMLTRSGNIPSETTSLTESGGHWTIGHTYATSGGRALYGWLHEAGNTGRFTGAGGQPSAGGNPAATLTLPPLAQAVTVTGGGALAQLVWSDSHGPNHPAGASGAPSAVAQSLGAPPDAALAPDQRPAVVTLPDSARYIFARGQDGHLYAAYTPGARATKAYTADVLWQNLSAPAGLTLASGASAVWDGREIVVVALATDGAVWARSGPPGALRQWVSLGTAPGGVMTGTPAVALAPAPATGPKGVWWVALAVGQDGSLYESDGRHAGATAPASTATASQSDLWSAWEAVSAAGLPTNLIAPTLMFSEPGASPSGASTSSVSAMDALVSDASGALWLLRRASPDQAWQARSFPSPAQGATLIDAALDPGAQGGAALTAYLSDPAGGRAPAAARPSGAAIIVASLPIATSPAPQSLSWNLLGYLQQSAATPGAGATPPVALASYAGQRALLIAQGQVVRVAGDGSALDLLAPGATVEATAQAGPTIFPTLAGAGSAAMGATTPASTFSDAFTSAALDPRWVDSDSSPSGAAISSGSLTLTALGDAQSATLSQGAPPGGGTITLRVFPGESWRSGGTAQAGLTLTLDAWNSATLSLRADGSVALCAVVSGLAQPCASVPAPMTLDGRQGAFLRVTQAGDTLRASASPDGITWTAVGAWRAPWLPTAGAALGAYAPLIAPPGAANPGGYGAVPLAFTSLSLFVSGDVQPVTGGPTTTSATIASARFDSLTLAGPADSAP